MSEATQGQAGETAERAIPAGADSSDSILGVKFGRDHDAMDDGAGGEYIGGLDDGERSVEFEGEGQDAQEPESDSPARDDKGRFVASGQKEPTAPTEPAAETPPAEPAAEPDGQPFELGGVKWKSREKAEQSIRTLREHYKGFKSRIDELEAENVQLRQANDSNVRAIEAFRLGQAPAEPRPGQQSVAPEPVSVPTVDGDFDVESLFQSMFDKDYLEAIDAAVDEGRLSPHAAAVYMTKSLMQPMAQSILAQVKGTLDPIRQEREKTAAVNEQKQQIVGMFTRFKNIRTPDGKLAYPFLSNQDENGNALPGALDHILDAWDRSGKQINPAAVVGAYYTFKEALRRVRNDNAFEKDMGLAESSEEQIPETREAVNSSTAAALASDSGPPAPPPSGTRLSPEAAEIRSLLRGAQKGPFGVMR